MEAEHRKFAIYGGIYALVLITILYMTESSLAYLVTQSDNEQTGKVNLVMQHKVDPEILILGSSVAEVGFNSSLMEARLGQSTYNMAIDGTVILRSEYIVDEFLTYTENCKIVVVGMAFFSLSKVENMHAPERFLAHKENKYVKENIKSIDYDLYRNLRYVPFYSFIIANHTYYKNALIGLKNVLIGDVQPTYSKKGFVPHDKNYQHTKVTLSSNTILIDSTAIETYNRILRKIRLYDVRPVLVLTPMHANGQKSFTNFFEYRNQLKQLAKETETQLFDFSEHPITQDTQYFYNNGHLNIRGAELFTRAACDSLLSIIDVN